MESMSIFYLNETAPSPQPRKISQAFTFAFAFAFTIVICESCHEAVVWCEMAMVEGRREVLDEGEERRRGKK